MKTKSEAIRLIKTSFDNAGIEMPEPIYRVHLRQAEEASAAKPTPQIQETKEFDLSVDRTIDRQVAAVTSADGETNLLGDES